MLMETALRNFPFPLTSTRWLKALKTRSQNPRGLMMANLSKKNANSCPRLRQLVIHAYFWSDQILRSSSATRDSLSMFLDVLKWTRKFKKRIMRWCTTMSQQHRICTWGNKKISALKTPQRWKVWTFQRCRKRWKWSIKQCRFVVSPKSHSIFAKKL